MSEVMGISNIGFNQDSSIKQTQATKPGSTSFSSYLEETKDMDEIFDQASKKYNVPVSLLKAIGKAESDFTADAVSKSGAQGVMQLMPATAAELGVTDSFDPEQNIMGGSKYISDLLKRYDGDINLALAAYNAGMNNVAKYGGIPPFEETQNYVVKVNKYMQQNLEAGTATLSIANSNTAKASELASGTRPAVNWYIAPSVQTQKISSSSVSEVLNSIFSYQDYMKFMDLFLGNDEDESFFS
ncbi:MAG TPA: lytic transglycosylase domain-containing protein [Mobilitalea sp.]|nr:lytic transglycosylase domain-containing protein [Mobilitalea sp.]